MAWNLLRCVFCTFLVVAVNTIDTWEEDFRSDFEERHPHAVTVALNEIRKYKVKAEKLGPLLLHCAGADVKDKFLVASRQGEEYSRLQQFQNSPSSCTQVQTVSLLDSQKQPESLQTVQRQICELSCNTRVLILEGLSNATLATGESLLAQIAEKKVLTCGSDGLRTDGWVVIVISDLGADVLDSTATANRKEAEKQVKQAIRGAVDALLVPSLCDRPTKSALFKHFSRTILPFVHSSDAQDAVALSGADERPASKRKRTGAEKRREVILQCISQWNASRAQRSSGADFSFDSLPFLGQRHAIRLIKARVLNRAGGWGRNEKPLVMVFWGPSGVGKTKLAELTAAAIHKERPRDLIQSKKFVTIPMGQYKDEHSAANLVGPPQGIKGKGQLTGALLSNPDAVVLMDEFEKGHPDAISDLLLGAFDDSGSLKDMQLDEHVPTVNATFILNTNIGSDIVRDLHRRLYASGDTVLREHHLAEVRRELTKAFKSKRSPFMRDEFRGRVDEWVMFMPYSEAEIKDIVLHTLFQQVVSFYLEEAKAERRLAIGWDEGVVAHLAAQYGGDDGSEGFRAVNKEVLAVHDVLREAHERSELGSGDGAYLYMHDGRFQVTAVAGPWDLEGLHGLPSGAPAIAGAASDPDGGKAVDPGRVAESNGGGSTGAVGGAAGRDEAGAGAAKQREVRAKARARAVAAAADATERRVAHVEYHRVADAEVQAELEVLRGDKARADEREKELAAEVEVQREAVAEVREQLERAEEARREEAVAREEERTAQRALAEALELELKAEQDRVAELEEELLYQRELLMHVVWGFAGLTAVLLSASLALPWLLVPSWVAQLSLMLGKALLLILTGVLLAVCFFFWEWVLWILQTLLFFVLAHPRLVLLLLLVALLLLLRLLRRRNEARHGGEALQRMRASWVAETETMRRQVCELREAIKEVQHLDLAANAPPRPAPARAAPAAAKGPQGAARQPLQGGGPTWSQPQPGGGVSSEASGEAPPDLPVRDSSSGPSWGSAVPADAPGTVSAHAASDTLRLAGGGPEQDCSAGQPAGQPQPEAEHRGPPAGHRDDRDGAADADAAGLRRRVAFGQE